MDFLHDHIIRSSFKPAPDFHSCANAKRILKFYRESLQSAERFVINQNALEHIVYAASNSPDKILSYIPITNLPFEKIWIEFDNHARVRIQNSIGTSKDVLPETPKRAGFLIIRDNPDNASAWKAFKFYDPTALNGLNVFGYMFDGNPDGEEYKAQAGIKKVSELLPDNPLIKLWGYKNIHQNEVKPLLKYADLFVDPIYDEVFYSQNRSQHDMEYVLNDCLKENAGDMRFIVSFLALINAVSYSSNEYVPPKKSYFTHGKQQPYLTHRTITLNIVGEPKKHIEKMLAKAIKASRKRRHRVRGHYRIIKHKFDHYRTVVDDNGNETKLLIKAGPERIWVESHLRGDGALGWINTDYEVTT